MRLAITAACLGLIVLSTSTFAQERSADWEPKASQWVVEEMARVRQANKEKFDELDKSAKPRPPAPAGITPQQQAAGAIVFTRPLSEPIGRREVPEAGESATLDLVAARNEYEGIQLGVYALEELKDLQIKVGPLTHADGKTRIADGDVRTTFVASVVVPMSKRATPADGDIVVGQGAQIVGYNESPGLLLDLPSVNVASNTSQGIWIDVRIPADATPGKYTGQATLSANGKQIAALPLSVQVRPFELDWAKNYARGPFVSKFLDRQTLIQQKEHGINNVSWWTNSGTVKVKGDKVVVDYSPMIGYLKLLDEVGYDGPHAHFISGSDPKLANSIAEQLGRPIVKDARNPDSGPAFKKFDFSDPFPQLLVDTMKQIHAQASAAGHPDLAYCLLDEPDHKPNPERRDFYIKMYRMVEKGAPEVPTYGTFYHAGDEDRLSHHHQIWTTNRPAKKIAEKCRAAGKELYTYGANAGYSRAPRLTRFHFGIVPWVFQAKGSFFWAQYWHSPRGAPLNPFEITDTSTVSIPTPHGPLASPALKAYREAIDDRRYMITLETLIARALAGDNAAAKQQAQSHQQWLDSFRLPLYENMTVVGGNPNFSKVGKLTVTALDGSTMDVNDTWAFSHFLREDVARRIEALDQAFRAQ